jgi:hypothetical protein
MKSYDVMTLFAQQLERSIASSDECKTKVVITPSSVNEKGVVIKVSLLKTFRDKEYQAKSKARSVRLRVSVCGTVESQTGLKMATVLIEKLDDFFEQDSLRLEEIVEGENSMQIIRKIPNTRIAQRISEEDSFLYNPDSTSVQDIQDDRMVTITFQEET